MKEKEAVEAYFPYHSLPTGFKITFSNGSTKVKLLQNHPVSQIGSFTEQFEKKKTKKTIAKPQKLFQSTKIQDWCLQNNPL